MRLFCLLLLTLSTILAPVEAVENEFAATPSECIATEKGDLCVMAVALTYPALRAGEYCLTLNDESLGCWPHSTMPGTVKITLKEESELRLVSESPVYHASVILTLRYRSASMLRRRVRNPWSLF